MPTSPSGMFLVSYVDNCTHSENRTMHHYVIQQYQKTRNNALKSLSGSDWGGGRTNKPSANRYFIMHHQFGLNNKLDFPSINTEHGFSHGHLMADEDRLHVEANTLAAKKHSRFCFSDAIKNP